MEKVIQIKSFLYLGELNEFSREHKIDFIDLRIIEAKITDWNFSNEYILIYKII